MVAKQQRLAIYVLCLISFRDVPGGRTYARPAFFVLSGLLFFRFLRLVPRFLCGWSRFVSFRLDQEEQCGIGERGEEEGE